MKSEAEVLAKIRNGAKVQWERGAVLNAMEITSPYSRGGPVHSGTVASCVKECLAKQPQVGVMYTMNFDDDVIEGLGSGLITQPVIWELAKRSDYPH